MTPITRAHEPGYVLIERRFDTPVYQWQGESFAHLDRGLRPRRPRPVAEGVPTDE